MKTMKSKGTNKKGDGLKKVIMEAKKTYKKHGGEYGGAEGGRRKTRRHSRK
jgi:Tfp pilus assembly protein PilP